jgi:hypothetical protein
MLPVSKIYISTKYKTNDSISNSNFKFELPQTITLPSNTTFTIDDVCIPHSWYNVERNFNSKLYLTIFNLTPGSQHSIIINIPQGNYSGTTLATKIQELLDANVVGGVTNGIFTVAYSFIEHVITINATSPHNFQILTDVNIANEIYTYDNPSEYDPGNIASINNVLRNDSTISGIYLFSQTWRSQFLDFLTIDNIYISSPNLGTFTTLGARGESNIIKKVPVSSSFGILINDRITSTHDFLDCSKQNLRLLEFHLKDVSGNYIPLHGADCSFSIVFVEHR